MIVVSQSGSFPKKAQQERTERETYEARSKNNDMQCRAVGDRPQGSADEARPQDASVTARSRMEGLQRRVGKRHRALELRLEGEPARQLQRLAECTVLARERESSGTCASADDEQRCGAGPSCRICHGGELDGPLISPCLCRGSMAHVHLRCLQQWILYSQQSGPLRCSTCTYEYRFRRPLWAQVLLSPLGSALVPPILLGVFMLAQSRLLWAIGIPSQEAIAEIPCEALCIHYRNPVLAAVVRYGVSPEQDARDCHMARGTILAWAQHRLSSESSAAGGASLAAESEQLSDLVNKHASWFPGFQGSPTAVVETVLAPWASRSHWLATFCTASLMVDTPTVDPMVDERATGVPRLGIDAVLLMKSVNKGTPLLFQALFVFLSCISGVCGSAWSYMSGAFQRKLHCMVPAILLEVRHDEFQAAS
eukprot:TRINITY_DN47711_c0_g1_i1.p1 TRINITY_DN47711_c0_g1~~TRINITY_DN47711_c0_g1_i1.p1  ORF type:complete len:423 (+),score=25.32 TRINITY_DN47711_c0_g1_i1:216-1484(+)